MTDTDPWTLIGDHPPEALVQPTLELHWALQVLASAGQTFAEPAEDDSHRSTRWDRRLASFVGEPFAGPYPFRVALRPADLTLQILERSGDALGSLPLQGQTLDEAYEWLAAGVVTYMGGALPMIERPEYDLPAHPVGEGARFSTTISSEFETLAALYHSSAPLLDGIVEGHESASMVRCWPHHFDIATLLTVDPGPDPVKTVGVGMAPMGGGLQTWYWYVSPWPYPDPSALLPLSSPGRWHTEGWTGAILEGRDVLDAPAAERRLLVSTFLDDAIGAASGSLASTE